MLKKEFRYDAFAYHVAYREIDDSIAALDEGQWITIQNGKVVVSDGTAKSFLCISSARDTRNQMRTPVKKASYLLGSFELSTTVFDATGTYGDMTPLVVQAGGELTPYIAGTHDPILIVAYALGAPVDGYLRICSAY